MTDLEGFQNTSSTALGRFGGAGQHYGVRKENLLGDIAGGRMKEDGFS